MLTSPVPHRKEWEVFPPSSKLIHQHVLTSSFYLFCFPFNEKFPFSLSHSYFCVFFSSLSPVKARPLQSRWKASAASCSLTVWLTAGLLVYFSIYLWCPEPTHARPLKTSADKGRWERGEMDGQMCGLWCVAHIKDSLLGSCWIWHIWTWWTHRTGAHL